MEWKGLAALFVVAVVFIQILTKKATDRFRDNQATAMLLQYWMAFMISLGYAAFTGGVILDLKLLGIALVAMVFNANANYSQWRASAISLSKTALFIPLSEVLGISLAILFLGEKSVWNLKLVVGVVMCFAAIFLLRLPKATQERAVVSREWFRYVTWIIVDLALITFAIKALEQWGKAPLATFLVGFYGGSFLGALVIARNANGPTHFKKICLWAMPIGICLSTAQGLMYLIFLSGGTMSQMLPVRGVAVSIIPALIGFFWLGEKKHASTLEIASFALGLAGAALILLR